MTAGIASESVIKLVRVLLLTDVSREQVAVNAFAGKPSNDVYLGVLGVGFASREQVRARLAVHVLHTLSEEPC